MFTPSTSRPRRLSSDAQRAMVAALRASLSGDVIARIDAEYDRARAVWNGLIDRRPAAIARPASTADVMETVRIAREFRPVVSIRGGGHQVAGSAVCDDGLVIDLSPMKAVHVDPQTRVARVQGGARWGDVDRETQRFGLATPGGRRSGGQSDAQSEAVVGRSQERLARIRSSYDPDGLFEAAAHRL